LRPWIEENLEIYKVITRFPVSTEVLTSLQPDLRRLLWPIFVYSFLELVEGFYTNDCRNFFNTYQQIFQNEHEDDLRKLRPLGLPEHLRDSQIAKIYYGSKYRVTLSQAAFFNLVQFLESKELEGGGVIISILQLRLNVVTVEHAADDQSSLAKLLDRARNGDEYPAEDEGIPGHNPGSANIDRSAGSNVLTKLKLGPLPMEPELLGDVRMELTDEDAKNPPANGRISLSEQFEHQIKREESEDAPNRSDVPLPPSLARDAAMEVQKVKEKRDRFKIESRTGGAFPSVSVVMFTFHNTYDG
jgi:transcription initiation factor TFIID subunit 5